MINNFDYEKFNQLEKEIENICFFTLNDLNSKLNNKINSDEIIYIHFDKIYKKIREQIMDETNMISKSLEDLNIALNENFLININESSKVFNTCKKVYNNTLKIATIFHLYYYIYFYHPKLYDDYGFHLFKVVFKFILYFDQKEIISFLKEICLDGKMLNFYIQLHNLISGEIDEKVTQELSLFNNFNFYIFNTILN